MKNILEDLELKLLQTKKENIEALDKIEAKFKKKFAAFFDILFKNDNLGFKRFISVSFQLEKLNNKEKSDIDILINVFDKALLALPITREEKNNLEKKFKKLLNNEKIDLDLIYKKNTFLNIDHNYPILEDLEKYGILNKNDIYNISLKYKNTKNFLDSISVLDNSKKEIVKSAYFSLNNSKVKDRIDNFENDFKKEIQKSKVLKIYPKIVKFIGKKYFRLNLKNKIESKQDRLKRLYKIIFLKLYRLKYSGIDINKILEKIDKISDFDELLNLIIKYFEVLKQNSQLKKDYIVSEEVEKIENNFIQAEENKENILFSEKNTIKINEFFDQIDKELTKNELDELLGDNVDLIGNIFLKREEKQKNTGILVEGNKNNLGLDNVEILEEDSNIDLEEYYKELKDEYEEVENKKTKLFLKGKYDKLDDINEKLLKILKKLEKLEKIIGGVGISSKT